MMQVLAQNLKVGDKISFWSFGDNLATIEKIFPIKTPFPFINSAMVLSGYNSKGEYRTIEVSMEVGMIYYVQTKDSEAIP